MNLKWEALMSDTMNKAVCRCGLVELEARYAPIVTTVCHCSGCREAGRILEKLPEAAPILDKGDGTAFVLFRTDRVRCVRGQEHLREHRLKDSSPTRRVVAVCCNTFMFLDFTKGHWITVARDRFEGRQAMSDAPRQTRQGLGFILRLIAAWAAMGFRTPKINYVNGDLKNV
jgi:hypothetical protein